MSDETSRIWPTGPLAIQLDLNAQSAAFVQKQQIAASHADKSTSLPTQADTAKDRAPTRMTKRQFVERVAAEGGLQKTQAAKAIDAALGLIEQTLARDEDVRLTGFGIFSVTHSPQRNGFNPKNQQRIAIPARRVPRFKPAQGLKAVINEH